MLLGSVAAIKAIQLAPIEVPSFETTAIRFTLDDYVAKSSAVFASGSNKFTMSFWWSSHSDTNAALIFACENSSIGSNAFMCRLNGVDKIEIRAEESDNTEVIRMETTILFNRTDQAWHHYLLSWDAGTPVCYVDGVSETLVVTTNTSGVIDFAIDDTASIGGRPPSGAYDMDGCISELWLLRGTAVDLSVQANREKFIDGSGNAVDLGSDGSTPTGEQPELYWRGNIANDLKNEGSGGDFTTSVGTLEGADAPPTA